LNEPVENVEDERKNRSIVTSLVAAFAGFYANYAGDKAPVEHFTRRVAKALAA
jgi:hypothetical protein